MKSSMSAVGFRRVLIIGMLLMIIVTAIGYYTLGLALTDVARDSKERKVDAAMSQSDLEQLDRMKTYLETNKDTVQRASGIVAESKQYQYQNQIVDDLNTYAARTGVTILGFNFSQASTQAPSTTSPTASSGLKTTPVTVTLENPVPYDNFLRFLRSIEQNLTKMQVTGVSLSPDTTDSTRVTNPTIGLEVYVR